MYEWWHSSRREEKNKKQLTWNSQIGWFLDVLSRFKGPFSDSMLVLQGCNP